METFRETPSQTVGPFFAYSLTAEQYGYAYDSLANNALVGNQTPAEYAGAERIYITGRVFDGNGNTIPDAIVELWQADPLGQYRTEPIGGKNGDADFTGFGRLGTGTQPGDRFTFTTLKPGIVRAGEAPHIDVLVFMRGSLRDLRTRLYFADETDANATDPLLNHVPADRRPTLLAHRNEQNGRIAYEFDIRVQGEDETVFFAL